MNYLIILFCLLISFTRFFIYKNYLDSGAYFYLFWAFIVLFASMRLYGLYEVSTFAYIVVLIGLIGYFIGDKLALTYNRKINSIGSVLDKKSHSASLNKKMLYILYTVTILILLSNAINVIRLLREGNTYLMIRTMYSNQGSTNLGDEYNQVLRSAINVVLVQFISTPVVYASLPILFVNLYKGNNDKTMLWMTSVMSLLWILTSGGRSIIVWSMIYLIFCYLYFNRTMNLGKKIRINRSIKWILIIIALFIITLVIFVTSSRRSNTTIDIMRQIYVYFPVSLKKFDIHLGNAINIPRTYGLSSFYGFIYPIVFLLHNFFGIDYPLPLLQARFYSFTVLEKDILVGEGLLMNAYATIFYQPYLDGGIIGVFLLLGFFGFICKHYYIKINKTYNEKDLVIYLYLMQKILFSHVRFYFTQTQQAMALIVILLLYYNFPKKRKVIINE